MTNGVSSNVSAGNISEDVLLEYAKNSAKATGAYGASKVEDSSLGVGFAVGSALLFEGIPLGLYLKRNAKINKTMTKDMVELSNSTKKAFENIRTGNGSISSRIGNFIDVINRNNLAYGNIRTLTNAKANIEGRKIAADAAKESLKKGSGLFGYKKLYSKFKNWRYNSLLKDLDTQIMPKNADKDVSFMRRAANICKSSGAGFMLALSALIEGVLDVYPAFSELGYDSGMRQLGKSTVKVFADTAGFIAGQQAGMAIGGAIGSAIFPGVGTAIGAITGLAIGTIGIGVADKITEKLVGKSEMEIFKEKQENSADKNFFNVAA